jgi:hypothetical protein
MDNVQKVDNCSNIHHHEPFRSDLIDGCVVNKIMHVTKYDRFTLNSNQTDDSWSWDSAAGIATGYELDDRGVRVRVPVGLRIFSSPRRPDRLWGPHSLLPKEYLGLFLRW